MHLILQFYNLNENVVIIIFTLFASYLVLIFHFVFQFKVPEDFKIMIFKNVLMSY